MKSISLYGTINLFDQKLLEKSRGLCYNIIVEKSQYESLKKAVKNKEEDWEELRECYPDTYDFLKSLENELETMGDY